MAPCELSVPRKGRAELAHTLPDGGRQQACLPVLSQELDLRRSLWQVQLPRRGQRCPAGTHALSPPDPNQRRGLCLLPDLLPTLAVERVNFTFFLLILMSSPQQTFIEHLLCTTRRGTAHACRVTSVDSPSRLVVPQFVPAGHWPKSERFIQGPSWNASSQVFLP